MSLRTLTPPLPITGAARPARMASQAAGRAAAPAGTRAAAWAAPGAALRARRAALQATLQAASTALQPLALPCLMLAALPAAGLMACTAMPSLVRGINPASADVLLALITLPLWLCLLLGFGGLVAAGRLDRWLGPRALQTAALLGGVTSLCWLSADAASLRQPALAWLAFVLPLLALGTGWALAWPRRAG